MSSEFENSDLSIQPVRHIGLMMPTHIAVSGTTPSMIEEGALAYASQKGNIQFHHFKYSYKDLTFPLSPKQSATLDGVLAFLSPIPPAWVEQLLRLRCPVVNTSAEPLPPPIARVHSNMLSFIPRVVGHFSEMGLKAVGVLGQARLAMVRTRMDHFVVSAREALLKVSTLETQRIPLTMDQTSIVTDPNEAEEPLVKYLMELPKPAGLFTFFDILGVHVVGISQQLGFKVPEDIAVVSAIDTAYCRMCRPDLSAIHIPFDKVGYRAMALLDQMVGGMQPPSHAELVPVDNLIIRGSSRISKEWVEIERARQYIHQNANRALTVNDVLEQVAVSRPTFERRFKVRVGCFPGEEIRRERINHLKHLLETTDLTVAAIAAKCGFSDVNKLTVLFKRETGTTPGKHRRMHREIDSNVKKKHDSSPPPEL